MNDNTRIDDLLARLRTLQRELEQELEHALEQKREDLRYSVRRGKVVFQRGVRKLQRGQRIGGWRYLAKAPISYVLSAPLIYGMILPLVLLDLSISLYQQLCFRIYRIPRVRRADYIVIDRHHLGYLNVIQKLNCVYCGYGNGLIAYAREITARTEQFWCPIKHASRVLDRHHRDELFLDYGDAQAFHEQAHQRRQAWSQEQPPGPGQ